MPFVYKIFRSMWLVGIVAVPQPVSCRLLAFRFVPGQRPAWVESFLAKLSKVEALAVRRALTRQTRDRTGAADRPDDAMDVSLIICTRDRCQQLARCLESVRRITFDRPWELIIVDNGSTDETAAVVREFIKTANVRAIYLFEPTPGKSNGLNTALKTGTGQILAFTDDDCYPARDFLSKVWSAFDDPSVGYIGGRTMLHDPADYRMTINESVTPRTFPAGSFVCAGCVEGANMAFRRRVLLDIEGFDPLFGPGSSFMACEDVDVVSRASAMGWRGEYHPDVVVSHHHGRKAADAAALCKSYAIGRGAFHMKLLLSGHQFLWFARSVYQLRWRHRTSRTTVWWELVGAAKYSYFYISQMLGSRLGQS